MAEPTPSSSLDFLLAPAGRGATVLVLGPLAPALGDGLRGATGPTGLVVACAPDVAPAPPGGVALRADPRYGLPLLSHSVDLAIVAAVPEEGLERVVEELRRVLAPGGAVRAVTEAATAYRLLGELHAAAFHDAEAVRLDDAAGVRATAPR